MSVAVNMVPAKWDKEVGLDIETDGLELFDSNILAITITTGSVAYIFLPDKFDIARQVIEDKNIKKIAHNANFELKYFRREGWRPTNFFCTMIAEKTIDCGRTPTRRGEQPFSLKNVLMRRLAVTIKETLHGSHFAGRQSFLIVPPTPQETEYMREDVEYLSRLRAEQIKTLVQMGMTVPAAIEQRVIPAVVEMEMGGMRLDLNLWRKHKKEYELLKDVCIDKMRTLLTWGLTPDEAENVAFRMDIKRNNSVKYYTVTEIAFGFSDALVSLFKHQLDIEIPNSERDTFAALAEGRLIDGNKNDVGEIDNPVAVELAALMTEYKDICRITKWKFEDYVNPITGKVHTNFPQLDTATARFKSYDPNMQQIPRPEPGKPDLRAIWIPDNDRHCVVSADYAQQEPRIAAEVVGDARLIAACQSEDIYLNLGSIMYNKPITKTSPERQIAKSGVLAVIFGAGAFRLHVASKQPIDQCEKMRQAIFTAFPGILKYRTRIADFARRNGYVPSLTGRRRYVLTPEEQKALDKGKDVKGWWSNAQNGPIQTSAADMLKKAMGDFWYKLEELRVNGVVEPTTRMWYTLHDEFGVHCHKNDVDVIVPLIKETMEQAGRDIAPAVTHIAELRVGDQWSK